MSTRPITHRRIHRVLSRGMPFAISGLLLATCFDAAAVSATSARTNAGVNGSQVPVDQQGSDPRTGEFSSSSAFSGGAGGGSADASAELGVIKVYAAAFSGAGGVIGSAFAEGAYAEDITVSSAGLNGTPGKITVGVTLQGFVDPQGSMGGQCRLELQWRRLPGFMERPVVACVSGRLPRRRRQRSRGRAALLFRDSRPHAVLHRRQRVHRHGAPVRQRLQDRLRLQRCAVRNDGCWLGEHRLRPFVLLERRVCHLAARRQRQLRAG